MFCEKCGKEIEQGAFFCANCGTPVNQEPKSDEQPIPAVEQPAPVVDQTPPMPVTDQPAPAPISDQSAPESAAEQNTYTLDSAPFTNNVSDDGNASEKKPNKKLTSIIIAGIIAVIVALTAIFAWDYIENFFAKLFMSDAGYFQYVNKKDLETYTKAAGKIISVDTSFEENSSEASISVTLTDAGKEQISDLDVIDEDYIEWFDDAKINMKVSFKDNKMMLSFDGKLNGEDIGDGSFIVDPDSKSGYVDIPDYSDNALQIEMSKSEAKEIRGVFELLDQLGKAMPDDDDVEDLLNKYIGIAFKDITAVEKQKENLTVGSISQKATRYEATITGDTVYNICRDVLTALKDDQDVKKILNDLDTVPDIDIDTDDVFDEIDELLGDLDDDDFDGMEKIRYSVWADGRGRILARAVTVDDNSVYYGTAKKGKNYEFICGAGDKSDIFQDDEDNVFTFKGKGTCSGGKYTGNYSFNVEDMEIVEIETEKFDIDELKKCNLQGAFTISVGDDLIELLDDEGELGDALGFASSFFKTYKVRFDFDCKFNKKSECKIDIIHGSDTLLTAEIKGKKCKPSKIKIPSSYDDDEDDWVEDFLDKFISKLEKAGVPDDIIDIFD